MVGEEQGRGGPGIEHLHWSIMLTRAGTGIAAAL